MSASDLDLSGRAAFITGGGGGIGRAAALTLAENGADVCIFEVIPERCEAVQAEIEARGRKALAICGNVMDAAALGAAIARAGEAFGRLDILVNNAGGVAKRNFTDLQEKNWRRHIEFNLVSVIVASQAAIPLMIAGGRGGAIVNVTSIEGSRAAPGYSVYAACKAGVNNLTRTLALELGDHGIRVNTIAPDYTVTPGLRGNISGPVDESKWFVPTPAMEDSIRRRTPLCRGGVDMECGKLVAFLASDMASYITGTVVPIDGGTWASSGWVRDSKNQWNLPPEA